MSIVSKTSVTQTITSLLKCSAIALLVLFVVAAMLPVIGRTGHRSGGRQIKDGTQVRNLVQACFTHAVSAHPHSTDAEDAALDAMQAEAVVGTDSHQPPAK